MPEVLSEAHAEGRAGADVASTLSVVYEAHPPTERAGKRAEAAAVRRLSAMLKAEPKPVYVDVGWARGVIDTVAKRRSPVEVKLDPRREIYKWQLYAEAYLLANALWPYMRHIYT